VDFTFPQVQTGLQRLLQQLDENGQSKLIMEIILFSSVESTPQADADSLAAAANRHRADVVKIRTAVETKVAAKQRRPPIFHGFIEAWRMIDLFQGADGASSQPF
jgi:hypothetical protein